MKLKFEKIHVYVLALIAMILPNIVYLNPIPQPRDTIFYMAFPKGEVNYDFFSYGKMMFLIFSTIFLTLIFLYNSYKKLKWQPIYGFIIVYVVLILLSTVMSPFRELAVRGLGDRYEGVFTLLSYLLLFFVAYNISKDKNDRKIVLAGIIAGSIIVGLVGIGQYWGFDIYRTKIVQQIITPKEWHNFNFKFSFGKATIYSSLYNTNFVGSYMVMMLFMGIGLYLNSVGKKQKFWSLSYSLLMFSNWIGCRSRAGFVGGGVIIIFTFLLFHKLIKSYRKELIILISSFAIVFVIMNTVKSDNFGDTLLNKYTTIGGVKTDLRDVYTENEFLIIKDKYTDIKIYQKQGKVQFYDNKNKILTPKISKNKIKTNNKDGKEVEIERTKISFENESYKRFSFNILGNGILELEYYEGKENTVKYPIFMVEDRYKAMGITGKLFDIVPIDRWKALDGYESYGSMRVYIWSRTLPLLKETMFLGYGPDTFSIVFPQNDTFGKRIAFGMSNIIVDKPHNMYLQIAVNTGIISMVLFIAALFIFFLDGIVKYRSLSKLETETFLWIGVLAYHVTALFNDSLVSVAPIAWIYLGISAGIIYNFDKVEDSQKIV